MEDRKAVEAANRTFYRALEICNIEAMDEVWLHDENAKCVHPGWEMIKGWKKIRESWSIIFRNTHGMQVQIEDVSTNIGDEVAWVTCVENVTTFFERGLASTPVQATNIFLKRDGKWLMVHHHASPIPVNLPRQFTHTIQ